MHRHTKVLLLVVVYYMPCSCHISWSLAWLFWGAKQEVDHFVVGGDGQLRPLTVFFKGQHRELSVMFHLIWTDSFLSSC